MTTTNDRILNLYDALYAAGGRALGPQARRVFAHAATWRTVGTTDAANLRHAVHGVVADLQREQTYPANALLAASLCCLGHALAAHLQGHDETAEVLVTRGHRHLDDAISAARS